MYVPPRSLSLRIGRQVLVRVTCLSRCGDCVARNSEGASRPPRHYEGIPLARLAGWDTFCADTMPGRERQHGLMEPNGGSARPARNLRGPALTHAQAMCANWFGQWTISDFWLNSV
jgi:hypothetical protein